jgi:hypothetical protein
LELAWPVLERAVEWCLKWRRPQGEIVWSVGPDGVPGSFALLAANSSLQQSLMCAQLVAAQLGHDRPHWGAAARQVKARVRSAPGAFVPKQRWAMDWYYPVLTGAVPPDEGRQRMSARWDEFVAEGLGVRCVADHFWVTAAETAECAMAAHRAGLADQSLRLLEATRHLRSEDGGYWTGCAHPEHVRWPGGQKSTYSAGAVIIADHVLGRRSAAAAIFSPEGPEAARGPWPVAPDDDGPGSQAGAPSWAPSALSKPLAARRPEAMQAGTPTPS